MNAIPTHAMVSPRDFLNWLTYQQVWPEFSGNPLMVSCPLCAAFLLNDWVVRPAHAEWHASLLFDSEGNLRR